MSNYSTAALTGRTRLAGVIGQPVRHTLSPAMHNAAFAAVGVDAVYVPLEVGPAGLSRLLAALADVGALGVNVTLPYKQCALKLVDRCSAEARRIGAVNTIVFRGRRLIGHNTDGLGFLASVRKVMSLDGQRVVLLGAGGAGRAVAVSLLGQRIRHLTLAEPDARRSARLMRDLRRLGTVPVTRVQPGSTALKTLLAQAGLLVNATPLGLKTSDPLPVAAGEIPRGICVMDLVYGRGPTAFLRAARRRRCRIIPGWHMLLYQGAEAFRLITGHPAPLGVMRAALQRAGV